MEYRALVAASRLANAVAWHKALAPLMDTWRRFTEERAKHRREQLFDSMGEQIRAAQLRCQMFEALSERSLQVIEASQNPFLLQGIISAWRTAAWLARDRHTRGPYESEESPLSAPASIPIARMVTSPAVAVAGSQTPVGVVSMGVAAGGLLPHRVGGSLQVPSGGSWVPSGGSLRASIGHVGGSLQVPPGGLGGYPKCGGATDCAQMRSYTGSVSVPHGGPMLSYTGSVSVPHGGGLAGSHQRSLSCQQTELGAGSPRIMMRTCSPLERVRPASPLRATSSTVPCDATAAAASQLGHQPRGSTPMRTSRQPLAAREVISVEASATQSKKPVPRGPERFFYDSTTYTGCVRNGGATVVDKENLAAILRAKAAKGEVWSIQQSVPGSVGKIVNPTAIASFAAGSVDAMASAKRRMVPLR